jgi:glycosyltransferase involved in cell wall biosynthesis
MWYGAALNALLREPWDLVHCWEEPYVVAAAQVARAVSPRVPVVFATFQNISKMYPPPFNWIERYSMARASGVVAFGRCAVDVVRQRTRPGTPVRLIAPGVDVGRYATDRPARATLLNRYGWEPGPPVVGFLGRFVPEKGCRLLMRVLDRVAAPWRALFVGAGPLEAELRRWSQRHGDSVRVETGVAHDEVPRFLNAMDVLCAPSQTTTWWREQFGRILIEAFACGIAVVGSDSGEIPHVIADAGLVVGEHDEESWVRALSLLLTDPDRRADMAARGRRRAVASFAWPVVARQHLEFFDEILDGVGGATRATAAGAR